MITGPRHRRGRRRLGGEGRGGPSCAGRQSPGRPRSARRPRRRSAASRSRGLVGVVLAGAARRVPVVLDGFIATAAGLRRRALAPAARSYLIAAHRSAEPGHVRLLEALGLTPYLELGMRLGEGTGAALGIGPSARRSRATAEMATFEEAGVSERLR